MKNLCSLSAITLVLCFFLLNCKEKENVIPKTNPTPGPAYASIDDVFDELGLKPKTVTIDAGKDASFYGNSGTRYMINANTLVKMDGTPVTGNVQVEVCEYLEESDMIFSKMLPISDGEPLISGGQIDIKATQEGQPLRLKDGATFKANIPQDGTADPKMEFFEGEKVEGKQNLVNWVRPKIDTIINPKPVNTVVVTVKNTPSPWDSLSLVSDGLKLCNADVFMTNAVYKTFTVTVIVAGAPLPSSGGIFGYSMYDTYKGVWPLYNHSANGVFNVDHVPGIPVHFVAFTVIGNDFYGGILGATPENGKNYTITLTKTGAATFKQQMNNL